MLSRPLHLLLAVKAPSASTAATLGPRKGSTNLSRDVLSNVSFFTLSHPLPCELHHTVRPAVVGPTSIQPRHLVSRLPLCFCLPFFSQRSPSHARAYHEPHSRVIRQIAPNKPSFSLPVSFCCLRPQRVELSQGEKVAREQQAACRLFSPDCVRVEHLPT